MVAGPKQVFRGSSNAPDAIRKVAKYSGNPFAYLLIAFIVSFVRVSDDIL